MSHSDPGIRDPHRPGRPAQHNQPQRLELRPREAEDVRIVGTVRIYDERAGRYRTFEVLDRHGITDGWSPDRCTRAAAKTQLTILGAQADEARYGRELRVANLRGISREGVEFSRGPSKSLRFRIDRELKNNAEPFDQTSRKTHARALGQLASSIGRNATALDCYESIYSDEGSNDDPWFRIFSEGDGDEAPRRRPAHEDSPRRSPQIVDRNDMGNGRPARRANAAAKKKNENYASASEAEPEDGAGSPHAAAASRVARPLQRTQLRRSLSDVQHHYDTGHLAAPPPSPELQAGNKGRGTKAGASSQKPSAPHPLPRRRGPLDTPPRDVTNEQAADGGPKVIELSTTPDGGAQQTSVPAGKGKRPDLRIEIPPSRAGASSSIRTSPQDTASQRTSKKGRRRRHKSTSTGSSSKAHGSPLSPAEAHMTGKPPQRARAPFSGKIFIDQVRNAELPEKDLSSALRRATTIIHERPLGEKFRLDHFRYDPKALKALCNYYGETGTWPVSLSEFRLGKRSFTPDEVITALNAAVIKNKDDDLLYDEKEARNNLIKKLERYASSRFKPLQTATKNDAGAAEAARMIVDGLQNDELQSNSLRTVEEFQNAMTRVNKIIRNKGTNFENKFSLNDFEHDPEALQALRAYYGRTKTWSVSLLEGRVGQRALTPDEVITELNAEKDRNKLIGKLNGYTLPPSDSQDLGQEE